MPKTSLYDRLMDTSTLIQAWKVVRAKNSAGGIDGMGIKDFEKDVGSHIGQLVKDLKDKTWKPRPYLSINIPKKSGEQRKLGLLSIKDKIVQQAIKQLIEPRIEPLLCGNTYAYRTSKGHTKAMRRTRAMCQMKSVTHLLRLDIDNYFDTIDHELLFKRLESVVGDAEIFRLIQLCVKIGMVSAKNKQWEEINTGVPQGAVLSPLLANFYLAPFDQFVLSKTDAYVRYADDFIIGCGSKEDANSLLERASTFLTTRLKLSLNEPAIYENGDTFEFLGLLVGKGDFAIREEKKQKLVDKILAVKWDGDKFTEKALEGLDGIRRYYVPLLPDSVISNFDILLVEQLKRVVESQNSEISSKDVLKKALLSVPFFSQSMILKSSSIRGDLLELYSSVKAKATKKEANEKNRKIIAQRKLEYRRMENETTELVISTPGTFIGMDKGKLAIKMSGVTQKPLTTANLKHIAVIAKGVSISSNAISWCIQNKVGIDFFSPQGQHEAGIYDRSFMQTSHWTAQSAMSQDRRFNLAVTIMTAKLKNQLNLVKYFHKYHKNVSSLSETYTNVEAGMTTLIETMSKLKLEDGKDYREKVMGLEANAATYYWSYMRSLLEDDDVSFDSRIRKGASDLVNSMLNYGYAILYARVWRALVQHKLNPYDSVIHAPQSGKPTFVFDVIEMFRAQAVDRVVITMIQKGEKLEIKNGLLEEQTKAKIVAHISERLYRYEKYRGVDTRLTDIIGQQTGDIAAYISEGRKFRPYLAKW